VADWYLFILFSHLFSDIHIHSDCISEGCENREEEEYFKALKKDHEAQHREARLDFQKVFHTD
jgi:hypothetical protein